MKRTLRPLLFLLSDSIHRSVKYINQNVIEMRYFAWKVVQTIVNTRDFVFFEANKYISNSVIHYQFLNRRILPTYKKFVRAILGTHNDSILGTRHFVYV
jgi:hypothetical protein